MLLMRKGTAEIVFTFGLAIGFFGPVPIALSQLTPSAAPQISLPIERVGSFPTGLAGPLIKLAFATIEEGWAYDLDGLWRTGDGGLAGPLLACPPRS